MQIEIEKFLQFGLNYRISDLNSKRKLFGTYKEKGSDKVYHESFLAYELVGKTPLEVYEAYIRYFNHTLRPYESERVAFCAVWEEIENE